MVMDGGHSSHSDGWRATKGVVGGIMVLILMLFLLGELRMRSVFFSSGLFGSVGRGWCAWCIPVVKRRCL